MNFNFKNLKEFFRDKSRDNLYQNLKDIGVDCNLAERGLNEEKLIVKETVLNDLSLIEGECFEI